MLLKRREREWQQHMSAMVVAALTGRVSRLRSPSLWVWLPLTAPTADKSGNIKENRRAAKLRYQGFFFFSSSPHLPLLSPLPKQELPSLLVFPFPYIHASELSEGGCDITRIFQKSRGSSRQWQLVLCQASPKASCDPALVSAHQDGLPRKGKRKKKKLNRMFLHLVNWQNSLLKPRLSEQICGRVSDWQRKEFGKWKRDELLSLDKVSELQRCFAWDSRKASKVWSQNKHAGLSVLKSWKEYPLLRMARMCDCIRLKENAPLNMLLFSLTSIWKSSIWRSGSVSAHLERDRSSHGEECFGFSFSFIWTDPLWLRATCLITCFWRESGASVFAKIFKWLGTRHGQCQITRKHSLRLLESLKCCCKSPVPVQAARPRLDSKPLLSKPPRPVETVGLMLSSFHFGTLLLPFCYLFV